MYSREYNCFVLRFFREAHFTSSALGDQSGLLCVCCCCLSQFFEKIYTEYSYHSLKRTGPLKWVEFSNPNSGPLKRVVFHEKVKNRSFFTETLCFFVFFSRLRRFFIPSGPLKWVVRLSEWKACFKITLPVRLKGALGFLTRSQPESKWGGFQKQSEPSTIGTFCKHSIDFGETILFVYFFHFRVYENRCKNFWTDVRIFEVM